MSFTVILNSEVVTSAPIVYVRNLFTPIGLDGVSIFVQPLSFRTDVNSFDETANSKMWLLELFNGQPKIKIKIDDNIIYSLTDGASGASITNPITYYRTNVSGKTTFNTKDKDDNDIAVQPIMYSQPSSSDNTKINTIYKHHMNSSILNYASSNDSLKIEIIINVDEGTYPSVYSEILNTLASHISFNVAPAIHNKPKKEIYELSHTTTYDKYGNDYNIRF